METTIIKKFGPSCFVVYYLLNEKESTIKEIQERTNLTIKTVRKALNKLYEENLISKTNSFTKTYKRVANDN